jgi:uncharacterized glyoxalase superfamily protein PhnB
MATSRLRGVTPVFLVGDIAATMRWYQEVLGFEADPVPSTPPHHFCVLSRDSVEIFLQQLTRYQRPDLYDQREGGVWNAYLHTEDVRALYDALKARTDVTVIQPLHRQPYRQTEFEIRDLDLASAAESARSALDRGKLCAATLPEVSTSKTAHPRVLARRKTVEFIGRPTTLRERLPCRPGACSTRPAPP